MSPKPRHYRGSYHVQSAKVRERAYANPETRCWRCHLRLHECGPNGDGRHKNGTRARWEAGHLNDGQVNGRLAPECSPCNRSAGARHGNKLRGARRAAQKARREPPNDTSARW